MKTDWMDGITGLALLGGMAIAPLVWMAQGSPPSAARIPDWNLSDRPGEQSGGASWTAGLENPQLHQPILSANTRFGINLFTELYQQDKTQNIFISPFSLTLALQMLKGGATGATHEAIAAVLQIPDLEQGQIDLTLSTLQTYLETMDSEVELAIANSFWMREGDTFNAEFIDRNKTYYQALTQAIDLSNSGEATAIINEWVAQQTHHKIDHILESNDLTIGTIAILVNAIYFKSAWFSPFLESETREHPFALANGQIKPHPVMFQTQEFAYLETPLFQAISLPYGNKAEVNFYIFLPNPGIGLELLLEQLNPETWNQWLKDHWEYKPVKLGLPRLTLDYEIELTGILRAMNMGIAFSPEADFSLITPEPFSVSKIKHKTFLEVNEEGTSASAVTGIVATRSGPVEMIIDRPFFFVIRDDTTGTLLFMGTVVNPTL